MASMAEMDDTTSSLAVGRRAEEHSEGFDDGGREAGSKGER